MKTPRAMAWAVSAAWMATIGCWLWDVAGGGAPRWLGQSAVIVALVLTVALTAVTCARLWRRSESEASIWTPSRLLLLLLAVALAVHWIGVDWEVRGRYYRDEGIYYAAANDINQGKLFPESFIYGHLPYYLYAVVLWIQSLFPAALARWVGGLFGVTAEVDVSWILLRGVNTTLGALTVIPVFVMSRRIGGRWAAVTASVLIVFSPIYNEITRLLISDVPSAFFAAMTMLFVSLLLEEERWRPYLWAGVAAALAAASKFPAGVVATAIVGVWIAWRIRLRSWSWHLVGAGLASLTTFLLVMPAFVVNWQAVFVGQGKDLLFGVRQYGRGGWIGVMPESNAVWYGEQLAASFGLPAILFGLVGWLGLDREARRRLIWMLPFPLLYLWLMVSMSMVVKRNLLPVLPALAAVLGVGIAGWLRWIERRSPARRALWASALMIGVLALPISRTTLQTVAFARASTREQAVAWIEAHVPRGAAIIKESYTPHLHKRKYTIQQTRFLPRVPMEQIRSGDWDYVLLARNAYGRFLDPRNWEKPHHELFARGYEEILQFEKVREFVPGRIRMGPTLELYKADPVSVEYGQGFRYAFVGEGFRYPRDDAYLLLKGYVESGSYEARLEISPPTIDGRVRVVTRDGRQAGEFPVTAGAGEFDLPWQAKYFFYIYLPHDTVIDAFELLPLTPNGN